MKPFITNADNGAAHISIKALADAAPLVISEQAPPIAVLAAIESRLYRINSTLNAVTSSDGDSVSAAIAEAIGPGIDECILLCAALAGRLAIDPQSENGETESDA